jgi:predicted Zn-dependent peptidase
VRALGEGARFAYADDEGSQADVRVSFPTFGERHPDAPVLHILARVLDDGMSTRVHRRVIDERGLAYEAFAELDVYEDAGVLDFGASVAHEKTPDVVATFLELAGELREEEVSEAELAKAKRRAKWDLEAMQDDDVATANFHGLAATFELESSRERVAEKIDRVSASDVKRIARDLLAEPRAHITVVGDLDPKTRRATERLAAKRR